MKSSLIGGLAVALSCAAACANGREHPFAGCEKWLRAVQAPAAVPYVSDSFADGVTGRVTGAFHVELIEGRDWVVDPLGRGTFFFGVQSANSRGVYSEFTGRARYQEWIKAHDGVAAWRSRTVGRLRAWGFNLLGHGCEGELERHGLAHAHELHMGQRLCEEGVSAEFAIHSSGGRDACASLPDMFHPDFPKWCALYCSRKVAPFRDDPWTAGWFIDNELRWWGTGDRDTGFFDWVRKLPPERPARKALESFVVGRAITPGLKREFLLLAARRYFEVTSSAIRAADPNHMVLGCRFAGVFGAGEAVWQAAGEFCDIVTVNVYPWCDLDRNVVRNRKTDPRTGEDLRTMRELLDLRHAWAKKPLMVTEWSFRAIDTGHPNSAGAGQVFRTQAERARAADMFLTELGSLPYVVGHNFFRWVDQPPEGIRPKNLEDGNYGLVNERDEPYAQLVEVFRRRQADIGRFRASAGLVANDASLAATGGVYAVGCAEGRLGGGWLFDRVRWGERTGGAIGFTVGVLAGERREWMPATNVAEAVVHKRVDGSAELCLRAVGGKDGRAFAARITAWAVSGGVGLKLRLDELVNVGLVPWTLRSVYFGQYVDFAPVDGAFRHPKTFWKGPRADGWMAADGRWAAGLSYSPFAKFRYWRTDRGAQHPDAGFYLNEPLQMAVGKRFCFGETAEVAFVAGTGGVVGWLATLGAF